MAIKATVHFFDVRQNWLIPYWRCNRVNRIMLVRCVAVTLFIAINVQQGLFLLAANPSDYTIQQIQQGQANPGSDIFGPPILLMFPIALTIGLVFAPAYSSDRNKLFAYALQVSHRYDKVGPIGFLAYDIFALFRMELIVFVSLASFAIGSIFCFTVGVLLVVPLFFTSICLSKVARLLITRTGYRLCYLVTLAVTLCSFWVFYPYLTWFTVGFVALLNGIFAFTSINVVRQLSVVILRRHVVLRQLARQSIEKNMEMGSSWVGTLFSNYLWPTYTRLLASQAV